MILNRTIFSEAHRYVGQKEKAVQTVQLLWPLSPIYHYFKYYVLSDLLILANLIWTTWERNRKKTTGILPDGVGNGYDADWAVMGVCWQKRKACDK